jgi:hypothetical protein
LLGYAGIMQADAFSGFNCLYDATSAASWNRRLSWRVVIGLPGLRPGNSQRSAIGVGGIETPPARLPKRQQQDPAERSTVNAASGIEREIGKSFRNWSGDFLDFIAKRGWASHTAMRLERIQRDEQTEISFD